MNTFNCVNCGKEYTTQAKKAGYCRECRVLKKPCPICGKEIPIYRKVCGFSCGAKYRLERFGNPWSRPDVTRKCQETRSRNYEPTKKANELKRLEARKIWEAGREQRKQEGVKKWRESLKASGKKIGMGNEVAKQQIMQKCLKQNGGLGLASEKIREKVKQTLREKYGVENVFQREDVKATIRQTMQRRYGVPCTLSAGPLREKCLDTIKKNYGVNNAWLIHHQSGAISKINRKFGEKFSKLGHEVQYEYTLGNFSYDLLIDNAVVLEINPTATHNEDISFQYLRKYTTQNLPVDHQHLERCMLARSKGKIPVFYFDWMSEDEVVARVEFLLTSTNRKVVNFDEVFQPVTINDRSVILGLSNIDYSTFSMLDVLDAFEVYKQNKADLTIILDRASGLYALFEKLGFKQVCSFNPQEHYCSIDGKVCKEPTSNLELQLDYQKLGLVRVLDCGKEVYTWRSVND